MGECLSLWPFWFSLSLALGLLLCGLYRMARIDARLERVLQEARSTWLRATAAILWQRYRITEAERAWLTITEVEWLTGLSYPRLTRRVGGTMLSARLWKPPPG